MLVQQISDTSTKIVDLLPDAKEVCFIIKGAFDKGYCQSLIERALNKGFVGAEDKYPVSYRNNDRLLEDNEILSAYLFGQCKAFFPGEVVSQEENLSLSGLNNRLRYCQYSPGQAFSIHQDGVYHKDQNQRSVLTFLLYLNDHDGFSGGETGFYNDQYGSELLKSYKPEAGDVAVFDHMLWHSGEQVTSGNKYILRSDIIYSSWPIKANLHGCKKPHHDGYKWKVLALEGGRFATASRDKSIKIWSGDLGCLQELRAHQNSVFDIAANRNGDLFSVSRDGFMTKWIVERDSYCLKSRIDTGHSCVLSVSTLNNNLALTSGSDGLVRLWYKGNELRKIFQGHAGWVWKCISTKNNQFVSCGADGNVKLWDVGQESAMLTCNISKVPLRCMATRNDNLFVGDEDGFIYRLDLPNLKLRDKWKAHRGIVRDIQISDGGVYSCGEDNKVCKFTNLGEMKSELYCHSGFATSMAITEFESLLSVSYSGEVVALKID